MTATPTTRAPRRHDLDALRGAAMLLGIAYHISLSFAEGFPWMVQDSHQNGAFMAFQNWVHGFRMPLFFILSGFFTAMLWRYRGLGATMKHRFLRIFLPLVIFSIPIIPLTFTSIGYAMSPGKPATIPEKRELAPDMNVEDVDLFTIIGEGTAEQLRAKLAGGANPNIIEPTMQSTPLSAAAFLDKPEMAEILLEFGADVNGRTGDGATALHGAAFLGNARIARQLVDAGIDIDAANERGETAAVSAQAPWAITQMIVAAFGIQVDRQEVESGRERVLEILADAKAASPTETTRKSANGVLTDSTDIWPAIESNDALRLQALLDSGVDPNINRPDSGVSALGYAAFLGHSELVETLLNNGADANHRSDDGGVPLHAAAFLGRYESGRLLIEGGAEINIANDRGETPMGLTQVPWGVTQSMAQMLGANVEKDDVVEGRKKLGALMKEKEPELQLSALNSIVRALTDTPLFIHLWFLVYLCWFAPVFAIYAWISNRAGWKVVPKWLVCSPIGILIWIALTFIPQSQMGLVFHTFGPDTSSGFLPRPDIFFYYSLFFFFGALYFDANDGEDRLGRSWKIWIPLATLVLFPIGLAVGATESPSWIPEGSQRPISVLIQAAFAWTLSIGFIGLFRATLTRERPLIRYISDSSYWLYIIHMPLVFFGQRYVRDWDIPAFLKFILLSTILLAFMLFTYHYLVRYTPIGTLLNGKRTRPKSPTLDPAPAA